MSDDDYRVLRAGRRAGKTLDVIGGQAKRALHSMFKTEDDKKQICIALGLPRWALFGPPEESPAEDLDPAEEVEAFSATIYDALGVPPELRGADTTHATSSIALDLLDRKLARDRKIVIDATSLDKVEGLQEWHTKLRVAIDKWRSQRTPVLLLSKDVEFLMDPMIDRVELPDEVKAAIQAELDAVPEEDRIYIESTPYPGETGAFERLVNAQPTEQEKRAFRAQLEKQVGTAATKEREIMDDLMQTEDAAFVQHMERCAGCGKTPCIPDSRGCCPNRPDEEFDLSWGDYETEPET